jgi:hypothetical protein
MRVKEHDSCCTIKTLGVFQHAKTRRFRDGFLMTIQFSGSNQGLLLRPETINIPHAGMNHLGFTNRGFPVSWVGSVGVCQTMGSVVNCYQDLLKRAKQATTGTMKSSVFSESPPF